MVPTRLAAPPTCLSCLRRLVQPTPSAFASLRPLAQQQTRGAKMSKAEQEDTQGIPVRLLRNMPGFGAKDTIIRVTAGRMRNEWFPKGQAEYMTKQRFQELQLTEAAVGVRDRTFGFRSLADESEDADQAASKKTKKVGERKSSAKAKAKETLVLTPEQSLTLLKTHIPSTLTFTRRPILQPVAPLSSEIAEPAPIRSPSLARHAATSIQHAAVPEAEPEPEPSKPAPVAIFGSVSASDILAVIKERLLESDPAMGGRVALEADGIAIAGLEKGEDRIKHLGTFEVSVSVSAGQKPIQLKVEVVAEE
ncbi:uncharacterized protein F4807DRAFT_460599 [Annulohypoxylon truncatum]|uniref:uncharacterized protein n=1 Tax=Annulohypoxylon truncatum TaxID=327061 RepID=UPI002008DA3B|nr:uncharacterized protein F4807DRAFT_460599 [Annulohypoxylon truncatum]KAI1209384.1 hypothetical protein F4807DRAFT_460599 [Annulohypoxylon truncatum]